MIFTTNIQITKLNIQLKAVLFVPQFVSGCFPVTGFYLSVSCLVSVSLSLFKISFPEYDSASLSLWICPSQSPSSSLSRTISIAVCFSVSLSISLNFSLSMPLSFSLCFSLFCFSQLMSSRFQHLSRSIFPYQYLPLFGHRLHYAQDNLR